MSVHLRHAPDSTIQLALLAPGLVPADEDAVRVFIAAVRGSPIKPDGEDAASVEYSELGLLFALVRQRPAALHHLEIQVLPRVKAAAARATSQKELINDAVQMAVSMLFAKVAEGSGGYRGRGSLLGWLCVVAMREARRSAIIATRAGGDSSESATRGVVDDHELDYMRRLFGPKVGECLEAAFDELGARDRNLLRFQVVEGFNVRQLGALYRVHHATAARWLEAIRKQLFVRTRELMAERHQLSETQFTSIVRLLRSELEDRLSDVFADDDLAHDEQHMKPVYGVMPAEL